MLLDMARPETQTLFTRLLAQAGEGNEAALNELVPLVYKELRTLAHRVVRSRRPDQTLRTTALIHEAYLKLAGSDVQWNDRVHFLAIAARAMRMILVDSVRASGRLKRGGAGARVTLDEAMLVTNLDQSLIDLDQALDRLAEFDARKSRIVELHYFGGLSYEEIAAETSVSEATVHRELRLAKAWIAREIKAGPATPDP